MATTTKESQEPMSVQCQQQKRITSSVKDILSGYYDAVNLVCSSLFVDPDFRLELYGFGCDSAGIPLTCHSEGSFSDTRDGLVLQAAQRYGVQAYHIPRGTFVTEACSAEENTPPSYNLVLNESPLGNGHVRVMMMQSHDQQSQQRLAPGGFNLYEGVDTRCQEDSIGFPLVSKKAQNLLFDHVGNLAMMHPRKVCRVREKENSGLHVDSTYRNNPGEVMQGLEMTLALETATWPRSASGFKERVRKTAWPSKNVINDITERGVYLIKGNPRQTPSNDDNSATPTTNSGSNSENSNVVKAKEPTAFDWKYSFAYAEKQLFETLSADIRDIFHALLLINDGLCEMYDIDERLNADIFKCVLFWCLEEGIIGVTCDVTNHPQIDDVTQNKEDLFVQSVCDVLSYLDRKLEAGVLPHYFLDGYNILELYNDPEFTNRLHGAVRGLIESDQWLIRKCTLPLEDLHVIASELDEARRQAFYSHILEKSRDTVQAMFTDMYKLAYMSLYSNLHRQSSLERCMDVHESIQRALTNQVRSHPEPRLLEWTSRLVSNSLANLYAVKALQTPPPTKSSLRPFSRSSSSSSSPNRSPGSQRSYYLQKAEELLLMSNNMDLITGRVRLANFFLLTNRLQEAWDLLHDVMSVTAGGESEAFKRIPLSDDDATSKNSTESESEKQNANDNDEYEFERTSIKQTLMQPIFDRNCILDLLFSEFEKPVLPTLISNSVHLTVGMLLGINKTAIYLLDPELFVRFLRVLTLIRMKEKNDFSAIKYINRDTTVQTPNRQTSTRDERDNEVSNPDIRSHVPETRGETVSLDDNRAWVESEAIRQLTKLEQLCSKEQRDLCEKRNVAYYNIVASCYVQLGLKDEAMRAFEASIRIVPNPVRNPAVMKRFSLKNEDTLRKIKGGVGVALAVGLTATIVGVVKSRLT